MEPHVPGSRVGVLQGLSYLNHTQPCGGGTVTLMFRWGNQGSEGWSSFPSCHVTGQDSKLDPPCSVAPSNAPADSLSSWRNLLSIKVSPSPNQSPCNKEKGTEKVPWSVTHTNIAGTQRIWNKCKFIQKLWERRLQWYMLTGDLLLIIDFTNILASDLFLLIELKWLMQHICFTDFGKI